jgi:hypothetical protein
LKQGVTGGPSPAAPASKMDAGAQRAAEDERDEDDPERLAPAPDDYDTEQQEKGDAGDQESQRR